MKVKIDTPIFVIGVGRSGTTLIQSMLNAHRDIAFTPETHFFRNFISNVKVNKRLINGDIEWIRNKIISDKSLQRLDINLNYIINQLIDKNKFSLKNFYIDLLQTYANRKEKLMVGDKDPKNIEYLHNIKRLFPNAYIIHIIRDPRDVIVSRMKAEWSKHRKFITHVFTYREQLNKGRKDGKKLFKNKYYEIFYENLIEHPAKSLKKVCGFLQIDYEPNMLNFNKKADEIIKGKEENWKENCFKPVMSSNKNKWRKKLSKKQVICTEKICKTPFESLGYMKSNYETEVSFESIWYKLLSKSSCFLDIIYNLYHKYKDYRLKKVR